MEWLFFNFYFAFIFALWLHGNFRMELLNTDALRGSIHFLSLPPVSQRDFIRPFYSVVAHFQRSACFYLQLFRNLFLSTSNPVGDSGN